MLSHSYDSIPVPFGSNTLSTGVVVTLRDANKTFVRDQADKWRMSETNALGQLVQVTEDPTAAVPKRRGWGPGVGAGEEIKALARRP